MGAADLWQWAGIALRQMASGLTSFGAQGIVTRHSGWPLFAPVLGARREEGG